MLNALRVHLAEIGIIAAQGPHNARNLAALIGDGDKVDIPSAVQTALAPLVSQIEHLDAAIASNDAIERLATENETARRLMSVPGIAL